MAAMNIINTVIGWGKSAFNWVTGIPSDVANLWHAAMQFAQVVLQLVVFVVSNPVEAAYVALGALVDEITGNFTAANNLINRIPSWTQTHQVNPLKKLMLKMFAELRARIAYLFALAYLYINTQIRKTRAYARALVAREREQRIADFKRSEAYTRAQVKAALALVQREAAGGYADGDRNRESIVTRLLDDIAGRNPELRAITSRIIGIVLDLATVDDPVARFLITMLMNKVIAKLGVDKALGAFTQSLIDQLAGAGKPKTLHDVIDDLTLRVGNLENEWATFMSDGGPQILQAGEQWKAITGVLADAGLLAFAVAATVEPEATARDLSDIIRPIGVPVIASLAGVLGKG